MKIHFTVRGGFWLARVGAYALVCVLTLSAHSDTDHRWLDLSVLAVAAVFLVLWGWLDWRSVDERQSPAWALPVTLGCLAFAGGLGTALGKVSAPIAFALMAVIGAGDEVEFLPACAITAAGILGVEISALVFGLATGSVLGIPLLLLAGLLVGRNRREVRARSDQAAALVLQMQLTQDEHRRAATLDERNRIAREIHDMLAHSISALGIQIGAARAVLQDSRDIEKTLQLLGSAQHLAGEGLTDARRAILALRTDTPPLPESLASLVEHHEIQNPSSLAFAISGDVRPLQPDANLALVRTAQEALTNSAKYAPGASVHVALEYANRQTLLTVTNTAPTATVPYRMDAGGGYGLAGMRERLLLLGGTLTAGPTENGWTVQAVVPQ